MLLRIQFHYNTVWRFWNLPSKVLSLQTGRITGGQYHQITIHVLSFIDYSKNKWTNVHFSIRSIPALQKGKSHFLKKLCWFKFSTSFSSFLLPFLEQLLNCHSINEDARCSNCLTDFVRNVDVPSSVCWVLFDYFILKKLKPAVTKTDNQNGAKPDWDWRGKAILFGRQLKPPSRDKSNFSSWGLPFKSGPKQIN